jgi:hypothetical protein
MTYTLIAHTEVGSGGAANIEFTSIPATFTDLLVQFSLRTTLGPSFNFDDMGLRINGDTGSNYTRRGLRTREGTVGSFGGTTSYIDILSASAAGATSNTFGSGQFYIPNYASAVAKSVSSEGFSESNSSTLVTGGIVAGLWTGTAAINALRIYSLNSANLVQYSSATLYGITSGSSGGVVVS